MFCQSLGSGAADSGKRNISQGACVLLSSAQTLEEVIYAVSAGEDKPFVVIDIGNSVVQRSVICCRNDFDCRSFDNLGTLCFQLLVRALACARARVTITVLPKRGLLSNHCSCSRRRTTSPTRKIAGGFMPVALTSAAALPRVVIRVRCSG